MGCKGLKRMQYVFLGSSIVACAHTVTGKQELELLGSKIAMHSSGVVLSIMSLP